MAEDKIRVLYVMPAPSSTGGMRMITQMYFNAEIFKKPGYYYFNTYYSWGESKFIRIFQSIIHKLHFSWFLLANQIDMVYVMSSSYWGFYDKVFYCLITRLLGKKSVLNPVGGHFKFFYKRNRFNRFFVPMMLRIPNGVISGTTYWFNYFKHSFNIKQLKNIPNPVIVPSVTREFSASQTSLIITFLARIEKEKGVLVFTDVVKKSLDSGQRDHFIIAGKGPALEQVNKELSKYVGTGQLEILGFVSEEEKQQIFKRTDIYVLPTEFEVLPVSLLEAMSYGCVVIATNVGGIPDAVKDGITGILLEEISEKTISKIIRKLDSDRDCMVQLGKEARIRMQLSYSLEVVLKEQMKFFLELMHTSKDSIS